MAASGQCFVEWKEQFVSKERGKRVVHYLLKDMSGESILAVVGTERSVRHMFYVVSEEFLKFNGVENSVNAGYRWRSRREVVNWLTSMLSKQHHQGDDTRGSLKVDRISGVSVAYQSRLARNLKGHALDIVWSGEAWKCGKQLKHFPAFCRNGITIEIQSFVFVMAEEERRHLAYLEDMYEDRKGQKKVKVRWFHHIQEVQAVITLRNAHPKEVFITPYAQVISVECVDGPAVVLTREHYEKCITVFPQHLLARVHLCFRQFKNNRVKPFKLSKLRGYLDQPVFSCLDPNFLEEEELSPGNNVKLSAKRMRSSRGPQNMPCEPSSKKLKFDMVRARVGSHKYLNSEVWHTQHLKVNEKIELLCQDSGIRGCWFRCTVLQVSKRQIKVQYDDLKDEDGCGKLEEWVSAFRLAMPDKLGMRYPGRPTIRPAVVHSGMSQAFELGAPVDVWWSDGWWEGVVTGISDFEDGNDQVYIPSESLLLKVPKENLRVSRDWVGDNWVNIEANLNILSVISAIISPDIKLSVSSPTAKDVNLSCQEIPTSTKLDTAEDLKSDLADLANAAASLPENIDCIDEKTPVIVDKNEQNNENSSLHSAHDDEINNDEENNNNNNNNNNMVDDVLHIEDVQEMSDGEDSETSGQKHEANAREVVALA